MGYKLTAKIKNKNSPMTPDDIDLVTFGLRKGEEIEDFNPKRVMTIFESIRGKYKGMMATDRNSRRSIRKPMTFSWFPRSDVKPVFRNLTGKPLKITIAVVDQDTRFSWSLSFDDVVLSAPKPDVKKFPPENYQRKDERFDGTFITFVDDPN